MAVVITHEKIPRYTDAEAIAAVEGEATLDLTGDVSIAAGKSLSVDTISEKTGAAGVTIDESLIKDKSIYPLSSDASCYFGKPTANPILAFNTSANSIIYDAGAGRITMRTDAGITLSTRTLKLDTIAPVEVGDLDISGHAAVGASASIGSETVLTISETFDSSNPTGINISLTEAPSSYKYARLRGIAGDFTFAGVASLNVLCQGLVLSMNFNNPQPITFAGLYSAAITTGAGSGLVTHFSAYIANSPSWNGTVPTNTYGFNMGDMSLTGAVGKTAYGVKIDSFDGPGTLWPFHYGDIGTVKLGIDGSGRIVMRQTTAPGALASIGIVSIDTGGAGGRQRLMVQFESGAAQVLATEP